MKFQKYKNKILDKYIKKYGSIENAVFEMDAHNKSLKLEIKVIRPHINWDTFE